MNCRICGYHGTEDEFEAMPHWPGATPHIWVCANISACIARYEARTPAA